MGHCVSRSSVRVREKSIDSSRAPQSSPSPESTPSPVNTIPPQSTSSQDPQSSSAQPPSIEAPSSSSPPPFVFDDTSPKSSFGISLAALSLLSAELPHTATIGAVSSHIVQYTDGRCSWIELVGRAGGPDTSHVGPASVHVVASSSTLLADLLASLDSHTTVTRFWFDFACCRPDADALSLTDHMRRVGAAIVVLAPWSLPALDMQCLADLVVAAAAGIPVDAVVPRSQLPSLRSVAVGGSVHDAVRSAAAAVVSLPHGELPTGTSDASSLQDTIGDLLMNACIALAIAGGDARALHGIGASQREAGCDGATARRVLDAALAACTEHASIAAITTDIALTFLDAGDASIALMHLDRVGSMQAAASAGPLETAFTLELKARALAAMPGSADAVLPCLEQSLALVASALGDAHPCTAAACERFGEALVRSGEFVKAVAVFERAAAIRVTVLDNDPSLVSMYRRLGDAHLRIFESESAQKSFEKAIAIQLQSMPAVPPATRALPSDSPATAPSTATAEPDREGRLAVAASYGDMARALFECGDVSRALDFLNQALAIEVAILGEADVTVAATRSNMGQVHTALGDTTRALELLQPARAVQAAALGERHVVTAATDNNIAAALFVLGDFARAREQFEKTLEVQRATLGENHAFTATTYNNLGLAHAGLGNFPRALELLETALHIQLRVLGDRHPEAAVTYSNISHTCMNVGDVERGRKALEHAVQIAAATRGEGHVLTKACRRDLASIAPQ